MHIVTIKGREYPMKYGHSALRHYMHKYGLKKIVDSAEVLNRLTISDMPGFVKAGFDGAAKSIGEPAPFELEEVEGLLEDHLWLEAEAITAFGLSLQNPNSPAPAQQANGVEATEVTEGN
jgi:hypothetical protein